MAPCDAEGNDPYTGRPEQDRSVLVRLILNGKGKVALSDFIEMHGESELPDYLHAFAAKTRRGRR